MSIGASLRQILLPLASAFSRLNPREQRLVVLFAGVAVISGFYVFVAEPLMQTRARMQNRIEALRKDLPEVAALRQRIEQLERSAGTGGGVATADFSLFSFIDKAATSSVSRESVTSMNPSRHPTRDGMEETSIELRLTGVTLPEVVRLLNEIEDGGAAVFIKRLELKRRYDDKARFDAVLVAGALSRT
jgi:type II secretory pathway component PulM